MEQLGLLSALPAYLYFARRRHRAGRSSTWTAGDCPTPIVLPSYPVLAVLLAVSAAWQDDWWSLVRAAIGGGGPVRVLLRGGVHLPGRHGLRRCQALRVSAECWPTCPGPRWSIGAFAGFLLGAVVGVALIAIRRGGRKTALPFGPFMIAGALLAVFVAAPVAQWYVRPGALTAP